MRKYYIAGVLLTSAALLFAGQQFGREAPEALGEQLPRRIINSGNPNEYRWIAASELTDQFGFLDMSLVEKLWGVNPGAIEALHEEALAAFNAGTEPPGCYSITVSSASWRPLNPPGNLDALVAESDAVLIGTIVAKHGGFFGGRMPGEVLEIKVKEWLGVRIGYDTRSTILAAYPGGEASVGMAKICVAVNGLPPAPAIGDQVMLFPRSSDALSDVPYIDFFSGDAKAGMYWSASSREIRTSQRLAQSLPSLVQSTSFESLRNEVAVAVGRSALR